MDLDSKCVFCDMEESDFLSVKYLFTKKDVLYYFTQLFTFNYLINSDFSNCKRQKPFFSIFLNYFFMLFVHDTSLSRQPVPVEYFHHFGCYAQACLFTGFCFYPQRDTMSSDICATTVQWTKLEVHSWWQLPLFFIFLPIIIPATQSQPVGETGVRWAIFHI